MCAMIEKLRMFCMESQRAPFFGALSARGVAATRREVPPVRKRLKH